MGFFQRLRDERAHKPTPIHTPTYPSLPHHNTTDSRYGQAALARELDTLATTSEGARNHQLNKTMFALSQLVSSRHLDAEETWQAVADTARRIGLSDSEIRATMKSAYRAGTTQPRQVHEWETPQGHVFTPHTPAQAETYKQAAVEATEDDTARSTATPTPPAEETLDEDEETLEERIKRDFPLVNFREIWNQPLDNQWLLEPLIPAGRLTALYSPPKLGKSLIVLEAVAHLAQGTPWLGYTPHHAAKILYIDFENDPRADIVERLKAMGYTPDQLDNLQYLSFPILKGLDTAQGANMIFDIIEVYQPELVVLDTLSRAIEGDENENDTFLKFYKYTELFLKKAGIAMLRIDHAGKDITKGQRGGSAKSGDVDATWKLVGEPEHKKLVCESSRFPISEKEINLKMLTNPLRHEVVSSATAWHTKIDQVNEKLDELGASNTITNSDAREMLKQAGFSFENSKIAAALKERKIRPPGWNPDFHRGEAATHEK